MDGRFDASALEMSGAHLSTPSPGQLPYLPRPTLGARNFTEPMTKVTNSRSPPQEGRPEANVGQGYARIQNKGSSHRLSSDAPRSRTETDGVLASPSSAAAARGTLSPSVRSLEVHELGPESRHSASACPTSSSRFHHATNKKPWYRTAVHAILPKRRRHSFTDKMASQDFDPSSANSRAPLPDSPGEEEEVDFLKPAPRESAGPEELHVAREQEKQFHEAGENGGAGQNEKTASSEGDPAHLRDIGLYEHLQIDDYMSYAAPDLSDLNSGAGTQRYLQFLAASAQAGGEDEDGDQQTSEPEGVFSPAKHIRQRSRSDSQDPAVHQRVARRASVSSSAHESLSESVREIAGSDSGQEDTASTAVSKVGDTYFSYDEIRRIFDLKEDEQFLDNFSAWFARDVMIQGRMYNSDRAIYYVANLPLRSSNILKASNLRKGSTRRRGYTRYWFVLRQNTFSYYNKPQDIYFPAGTIDLSRAKYAKVDTSNNGDNTNAFMIVGDKKTYYFKADTANSAHEWAKTLQKEIFRIRSAGNLIKLRIPWANVVNTDFGEMTDLLRILRLSVVKDPAILKTSSYIFSLFLNADESIRLMRRHVQDLAPRDAALLNERDELTIDQSKLNITEHVLDTAHNSHSLADDGLTKLFQTPIYESSGPALDPKAVDSRLSHENTTTKDMLNHIVAVPKGIHSVATDLLGISGTGNVKRATTPPISNHISPTQTNTGIFSEASSPVETPHLSSNASSAFNSAAPTAPGSPTTEPTKLGHVPLLSGVSEKVKQLAETIEPKHDVVRHATDSFSLSTGSTLISPTPTEESSSHRAQPLSDENLQETNDRYRKFFAFGDEVFLVASYLGHLTVNSDHLYGKIHISNEFFTFRRLGLGTDVRMIMPIDDIDQVQDATRKSGGYPVQVINEAYGAILVDFPSKQTRQDFVTVLAKVRSERKAAQRSSTITGELPTEEDELTLNLRHARLCTYEQIINNQLDIKVPPVMIDPLSSEAHEYFLARPLEPLRVTMLTIGSRGDVQPYIALSQGLMREGHKCKIATHLEFKDFVESYGIEFAEVAGNPKELMEIMIEHGSFSVSFLRDAASKFRGWVGDLLETSWKACQDTDLLIESPSAMAGIHIAEALRIPYFRAFTMPWTRTRTYPHAFIVPDQNLGGSYNYFTYVMFDTMFWKGISGKVNSWRKHTLNLPKTSLEEMHQTRVPFLYNVSPIVLPPPVDSPDWIHVTGYWFMEDDNGSKGNDRVDNFIQQARAAGKKVVYIGFGSIVVQDPKAVTQSVIDAVQRADVYCVLAKGWSSRGQSDEEKKQPEVPLPPTICSVDSIDHTWLFPRIDAAVHHGGSGTTGASLRWGLPTVIKPFFGDQFFYAHRVEDMGVGLHLKQLNASSLAKVLTEITTNDSLRAKAKAAGEHIRHEHGVENAVFNLYRELSYARSLIRGPPSEPPGRPDHLKKTSDENMPPQNRGKEDPVATKLRAAATFPLSHSSSSSGHKYQLWPSALNPFKHGERQRSDTAH